jgi:hypothetical protein
VTAVPDHQQALLPVVLKLDQRDRMIERVLDLRVGDARLTGD